MRDYIIVTLKIIKGGRTFIRMIKVFVDDLQEATTKKISFNQIYHKAYHIGIDISKDIEIPGLPKLVGHAGIVFIISVTKREELEYYFQELKSFIYS